jgi:hypothetical protein
MVAHTSALQPYGQCSELSGPNPNVSVYDLPTDSENEAEVDELESDTDPEDELAASASAHQKKSGRRLGERVPGTTLLPPSKVENIVQPDSAFKQNILIRARVKQISSQHYDVQGSAIRFVGCYGEGTRLVVLQYI